MCYLINMIKNENEIDYYSKSVNIKMHVYGDIIQQTKSISGMPTHVGTHS